MHLRAIKSLESGEDKNTIGFYLYGQNKKFIFTDRCKDEADAEDTFLHECFHMWINDPQRAIKKEMCQRFWDALFESEYFADMKDKTIEDLTDAGYSASEHPEELVARLVGGMCATAETIGMEKLFLSTED